jgi:hypothetical protein
MHASRGKEESALDSLVRVCSNDRDLWVVAWNKKNSFSESASYKTYLLRTGDISAVARVSPAWFRRGYKGK